MISLSIEECSLILSAINVYKDECKNCPSLINKKVYDELETRVIKELKSHSIKDNLIP